MDKDTIKIEKLITEGKMDEAEKLIRDMLTVELTPEEKGRIYADLASVYMRVVGTINEEYKEVLEKLLKNANNQA